MRIRWCTFVLREITSRFTLVKRSPEDISTLKIMVGSFIALDIAAMLLICTMGQTPVQVVPQGIEPVNGSDVSMRCTSPLEYNGSVGVCTSGCSALLDGISPTINTSTSDWASQLVTVRKTEHDNQPFTRVLLTFGFDTAVTVTGIELDLFLCPEWNIGAPVITVYANRESNLTFSTDLLSQTKSILSEFSESSCDSLSTVTIILRQPLTRSSFLTWHILMSQFGDDAEWAHIGEVKFLGDGIISGFACSVTRSDSISSHICMDSKTCPAIMSSISGPTDTTSVSGSDQTGVIVGVVVPLILIIVVAIVAVVGVIIFMKHRSKLISSFSDTDLGKWQNVVNQPGGEFQRREQHEDNTGNNSNAHHQMADSQEPPNQYDLQNQLYCSSSDAQQEYMAEGLYDEVTKDDLADDEYEDAKSRPVPSLPPRREAAACGKKTTVAEVAAGTPVYSHINKKGTPSVPQKSKDLIKYLSTQEAISQATPHLPMSKKPPKQGPMPQPQLGRISENPVYGGSGGGAVAMSSDTQEYPTGEDLYDRPRKASLSYPYVDGERELSTSLPPVPPFSESIYNEPIKPSDFTVSDSQDEGTSPHIYAPVYAIPTMLPEGFQQPVEITSDNIIEKKELGVGQFGKVILAATNGLSLKDMQLSKTDDNRDISILVAVKKLAINPSREEREVFEKEVKFMSCLKHQNVVSLIAVCYNNPAFIMMEYMEEGDLSQFLQRYSDIVPITTFSSDTQITTSTLVYMASQIASAMQYLTSHNYIHRDLASRNCLVGGDFTVKLADFGMSRSLYQSHYYRIQGNAVLPIRWMATESFFGIFSEKSDVWAFGVTIWELFTLAKEDPYSHLTDTEVVDDAIKGVHRQLLSRPPMCPKSVYKIMQRCWVIDPKGRACFKEVEELLQTYWYTPDATM